MTHSNHCCDTQSHGNHKVDDARISAIWLAAWLFYPKNQSQIAAVNNVTSNNICIAEGNQDW
jgi:hypothetical protein